MSEAAYILGISSHFHDASAALVHGERIVAAAQEERFSRRKADWRFPDQAIAYCLSQLPAGASLEAVAYYEDPGLKTRRMLDTARKLTPKGARLWPRMLDSVAALADELPRHLLTVAGAPDKLFFVPHHRSHAASAFYPSPFERAAVLVIDGVGEWSTTSLWTGDENGLRAEREIRFPHSVGLFYSAFTQYCGFKVNSGEYKLMGLASFGTPRYRKKIIDNLIHVREDGSFELNMAYFDFDKGLSTTSPLFEMLFGVPERQPTEPITPFHMNVAASAQAVLEEMVLQLAASALRCSGQHNLCLAGGVALNCLANTRLLRELPDLQGLWIQPAAGDAGGSLGAALEVSHVRARARGVALQPKTGKDAMSATFLGPGFDDADIQSALDAAGLVYQAVPDPETMSRLAAEALAQKQVLGHFHGRMEFGPRALGNRSILADPRGKDMLKQVNRRIKFREDWRPFAPMVLADKAEQLFEAPSTSPYMLLVSHIKPAFRGKGNLAQARSRGLHSPMELQSAVTSDFAAVTHVDFSARLQTVTPGEGTRAADIVQAFYELTGCPMLLNTSFNVRGEPLVCKPKDAVDCFLNTHMDLLLMGPFLVRKSDQPAETTQHIGSKRFAAD